MVEGYGCICGFKTDDAKEIRNADVSPGRQGNTQKLVAYQSSDRGTRAPTVGKKNERARTESTMKSTHGSTVEARGERHNDGTNIAAERRQSRKSSGAVEWQSRAKHWVAQYYKLFVNPFVGWSSLCRRIHLPVRASLKYLRVLRLDFTKGRIVKRKSLGKDINTRVIKVEAQNSKQTSQTGSEWESFRLSQALLS